MLPGNPQTYARLSQAGQGFLHRAKSRLVDGFCALQSCYGEKQPRGRWLLVQASLSIGTRTHFLSPCPVHDKVLF
jgi:hypothetical protein